MLEKQIFELLRIQDERSCNAYLILEALLNSGNIIDDKIERFQGLWQMNMLNQEEVQHIPLVHHIKAIRALLKVRNVQGIGDIGWVRVGNAGDGGYVMVNHIADTRIAYSIGIADDVSWDKSFLEYAANAEIYQYDHTIDRLPEENPQFHWKPIGVCGEGCVHDSTLQSLSSLIKSNGHSNESNMILKMDIEGMEYDVLATTSKETLSQFSQIVLELHHLTDMKWKNKICSALQQLNETHQLIYVHANNYLPYVIAGGQVLPELLECTYVNRSLYEFMDETRYFPTELDFVNYSRHPEIFLGNWGKR